LRAEAKRVFLSLAYPYWRSNPSRDGYSLAIAAPMDMPFLTYLALTGLRNVDLRNCEEVLVAPDGCGAADTSGLEEAIAAAGVKNARLLPVSLRQRFVIALFGQDPGLAHWTAIVESIDSARTEWIFLHDTDAFFLEASLVESSYEICRVRSLQTLGVTARIDPEFRRLDIRLPGTWELMFAAPWARRWSPVDHKSGLRNTPDGRISFDTMLYPQYRDYRGGKVQVLERDSFLHLSGTVTTYRAFADLRHRRVGDELFRLLFLSLLRDAAPRFCGECALPTVEQLIDGLDDAERPVHYCFPRAAANYSEFRAFMTRLIESRMFQVSSDFVAKKLAPFDSHFDTARATATPESHAPRLREHCLWLG
jgi:hypothetical protein